MGILFCWTINLQLLPKIRALPPTRPQGIVGPVLVATGSDDF
jgi:hypothetical protein